MKCQLASKYFAFYWTIWSPNSKGFIGTIFKSFLDFYPTDRNHTEGTEFFFHLVCLILKVSVVCYCCWLFQVLCPPVAQLLSQSTRVHRPASQINLGADTEFISKFINGHQYFSEQSLNYKTALLFSQKNSNKLIGLKVVKKRPDGR